MSKLTDHRPNIQVIGVGQKKDYNKIYSSLVLTELVPTGTHYLLTLEAPTGKFEAEVTKEVWDTHVLPAYQVAIASMNSITKIKEER